MTAYTATLLIELLVEEMPPGQIKDATQVLNKSLLQKLKRAGFCQSQAPSKYDSSMASPRRIVIKIDNVSSRSTSSNTSKRGPAVENAKTETGEPTAALEGFLRRNNASVEELEEIEHRGRTYVSLPLESSNQSLENVLGSMIEETLSEFSGTRMMRWGSGLHRFIRPIRSVFAIHGSQTIRTQVWGKTTTENTVGHRFLHPKPVKIASADNYAEELNNASVRIIIKDRRDHITRNCLELGANDRNFYDLGHLLDETTQMCEWPTGYLGEFDEKYLNLPKQVVVGCMTKHLRSFPVYEDKKLQPKFIFIADNEFKDESIHVQDIERVMRARLDDALFIYEADLRQIKENEQQQESTAGRKKIAANLLEQSGAIAYLDGLGNIAERVERIKSLTRFCAKALRLNSNEENSALIAAKYCKSDMATELVTEYPELEGCMAAEYVIGINERVKEILGTYLDQSLDTRSDCLRERDCLVLAHELERLVAVAMIRKPPSGSSDPYGLRRCATRIVMTMTRHPNVDANELLDCSITHVLVGIKNEKLMKRAGIFQLKLHDQLRKLIFDRIGALALEIRSFAGEVKNVDLTVETYTRITNAVREKFLEDSASSNNTNQSAEIFDIADMVCRFRALGGYIDFISEKYHLLKATNKRLDNINNPDQDKLSKPDDSLFTEKAEKDLYLELDKYSSEKPAANVVTPKYYVKKLDRLVELCPLVNDFFDNVMVNDKDEKIRANRHALVRMAYEQFNEFAVLRRLYS